MPQLVLSARRQEVGRGEGALGEWGGSGEESGAVDGESERARCAKPYTINCRPYATDPGPTGYRSRTQFGEYLSPAGVHPRWTGALNTLDLSSDSHISPLNPPKPTHPPSRIAAGVFNNRRLLTHFK